MNLSLTPEVEQAVHDRVASGRYASASEVVREALRVLEHRDRSRQAHLEHVRAQIAMGLEALDEGRTTDGDQAFDDLFQA